MERTKKDDPLKTVKGKDEKPDMDFKLRKKLSPEKTFRVNMLLMNGSTKNLTVKARDGYKIEIEDMLYLVDEDAARLNSTYGCMELFYHEGICVPYKIDTTAKDLRDAMNQDEGFRQVETSCNPSLLPHIIKAEYAKGIVKGAEISEFFQKFSLYFVALLIMGAVNLLIGLSQSGILD